MNRPPPRSKRGSSKRVTDCPTPNSPMTASLEMGGSGRPPCPPALVAPRRSRAAPRHHAFIPGGSGRPPCPPALVAPRRSRAAPRHHAFIPGRSGRPPYGHRRCWPILSDSGGGVAGRGAEAQIGLLDSRVAEEGRRRALRHDSPFFEH